MQQVIFMCGLPASGKTTFSLQIEKEYENFIRIGADDVRKDLYGSQDEYGNPEQIYAEILKRMKAVLSSGKNLIYDAVNMRKDYRMDFMNLLNEFSVQKNIIVLDVDKNICKQRFLERKRTIPFSSVEHYYSMKDFPSKDEGWDNIWKISNPVEKISFDFS